MARWLSYIAALGSAATIIVLLLLGLLASGCTTGQRADRDPDLSPMTADAQRGRSLVFDGTPTHATANALNWYDLRQDVGPEVFAGYQSVTVSTVYTNSSHDSQVHNGRVRDHSHDRTYRESVRTTVR